MEHKDSVEHAWRYFELHSGQRMSGFNFFMGVAGFALAGIGGCVAAAELRWIGTLLGLVLVLIAFVFYQLDQRTAFLIKHAESALITLEEALPETARVFGKEPDKTKAAKVKTYGWCFRVTFGAFALLGMLSAFYCFMTAK